MINEENDFFSNEKELGLMYNQIEIGSDQSKFNNISEINDTVISRDSSIYNSLNGSLEYEKVKNKIFSAKELREIENHNLLLDKKNLKSTNKFQKQGMINNNINKDTIAKKQMMINQNTKNLNCYENKKSLKQNNTGLVLNVKQEKLIVNQKCDFKPNATPKAINANMTMSNNQNITNIPNNQNFQKKQSNQSNLNNSRSKSKNNDNKSNSPHLQPQLKNSNSSNIIDSSKSFKKSMIKENGNLIKKDYSTLNENNSIYPLNKDEKIKTHMSKKSINIIEKTTKNLDDLPNLRASPISNLQFKKYSVSPNQKHPLESVIKENSDLLDEDYFDSISYRERLTQENIDNKTQKITIRSSNTAVVNTNINSYLLGQNTQQKNKVEIKNSVLSTNSSNNFNTINKKFPKKTLSINNTNSEAIIPSIASASVKNINSNAKSTICNSNVKITKKPNLKENMKSSQNNFIHKSKTKQIEIDKKNLEKQKFYSMNNAFDNDFENKFFDIVNYYNDEIEGFYYEGLERIQSIFDEKVNKIQELNFKYEETRSIHENDIYLKNQPEKLENLMKNIQNDRNLELTFIDYKFNKLKEELILELKRNICEKKFQYQKRSKEYFEQIKKNSQENELRNFNNQIISSIKEDDFHDVAVKNLRYSENFNRNVVDNNYLEMIDELGYKTKVQKYSLNYEEDELDYKYDGRKSHSNYFFKRVKDSKSSMDFSRKSMNSNGKISDEENLFVQ